MDDAPTLTQSSGPSPERTGEPTLGSTHLFGRYRKIRELGRGGMGIVWLAQDEVLGVPMALKLVPEQVIQDTEGINDLKKEVLRGMALTHPGIVRVYSFERDASMAAIVMEYVEGSTLGERKLGQPGGCFDCEQILPWLEQLCAALDYAHQEARIAHRDLKPRNLIVTPAGRLKVADFGIASSLSDTMGRVSVRLDASGTPPYMSPQQAMGERPTHLDDIYSLGATLYELFTGKPPFYRGNILAQVVQQTIPSVAERRAQLGVTDKAPLPPAWEKLVAACLMKNPEQRPANGAAVLQLLQATAAPEPVVRTATSLKPLPEIRQAPGPEKVAPVRSMRARNAPERNAWEWPKTLALVLTAAAVTAGGLHFLRHSLGTTPAMAPQDRSALRSDSSASKPAANPAVSPRSPVMLGEPSLDSSTGLSPAKPGAPARPRANGPR